MFNPRRELGRTGFRAAILGIGDVADRNVPIETCVATIRRAMDAGLNLIDTAPGYEDGYSEEIVGRALRGRRDGMFVIDKIDHLDRPVRPQVDESLSRLGIDAADLLVFHGVSEAAAWQRLAAPGGGFDELAACVRAGKARFRGISSHSPDVLRAAVESGLCDVVLFAVGPFCDSRYIDEILPLARRRGVGTVCFKTFGAGKLLGDTTGYSRPLQVRPRGKMSSGGAEPGAGPALPHLSAAECVRYTLTCDPDVALLGLSFPNEQDAAFEAAAAFRPLSPGEVAAIRRRAAEAMQGKGDAWWNPTAPQA
jgi:aryl-alcohol dehydrogenase-like predicted oxidoreductase